MLDIIIPAVIISLIFFAIFFFVHIGLVDHGKYIKSDNDIKEYKNVSLKYSIFSTILASVVVSGFILLYYGRDNDNTMSYYLNNPNF